MSAVLRLLPVALLALVACPDASAPVDPVWGKQACGNCAMLVSDRRFAAELTTDDGVRVFFDDPGCMATWLDEGRGHAQKLWVHSAAGTWIDARTARYAKNQASPMGFDFAPAESGEIEWAGIETDVRGRKGAER